MSDPPDPSGDFAYLTNRGLRCDPRIDRIVDFFGPVVFSAPSPRT